MREALRRAYKANGVDHVDYSPPVMNPWYPWAMGHLGLLGMFAKAQDYGLVSNSKRSLIIGRVANQGLLEALRHRFTLTKPGDSGLKRYLRDASNPALWSDVDRLEMVRAHGSFIEIYQLWEEVWRLMPGATAFSTPFEFSEEYCETSRKTLSRVDVDFDKPVVALHVRQRAFRGRDDRAVSQENYLPAIEALIKAGYNVVHFGENWMKPFPTLSGLTDLVRLGELPSNVDGYLLRNCRFLVSSHSGPFPTAMMLGTPTLVTNGVSLGNNCLSGPTGSLFLPKHCLSLTARRRMSLHEILDDPIGYSIHNSATPDGGAIYEENSADEILNATLEMIQNDVLQNRVESPTDRRVNDIRFEKGAVSRGRISQSFMSENQSWLT